MVHFCKHVVDKRLWCLQYLRHATIMCLTLFVPSQNNSAFYTIFINHLFCFETKTIDYNKHKLKMYEKKNTQCIWRHFNMQTMNPLHNNVSKLFKTYRCFAKLTMKEQQASFMANRCLHFYTVFCNVFILCIGNMVDMDEL